MDIALSPASLRAGLGTEPAHGVIPPGLFPSSSWSWKAGIPPASLPTEGDKDPKPWDPKGRTQGHTGHGYQDPEPTGRIWDQRTPGHNILERPFPEGPTLCGIWDGTEGAGTFLMEDSMPTAGGGNEVLLKVPSNQSIPRFQDSLAPGMAAPVSSIRYS